ncbi:MAG: hypothetical protein R6T98_10715, partial [Desulfatiglandales bacterium]
EKGSHSGSFRINAPNRERRGAKFLPPLVYDNYIEKVSLVNIRYSIYAEACTNLNNTVQFYESLTQIMQ